MPRGPGERLDSLAYTIERYRSTPRALSFRPGDPAAWQVEARRKFVELIGPFPAEKVALDPEFGPAVARPGHSRTPVTFATRPGLAAMGYLLVPDGPPRPRPAILCVPGHGRGVDDIVGIDESGTDRDHDDGYQHDFAVQCVRRGHVALAIEPLGFGHRRDPAARSAGPNQSSCLPTAGAALLLGETMLGWRVWDAIRGLDLLSGRPEVDASRLGIMGISGGGTVSLATAAVDERVRAACVSGYFCTFLNSIFSLSHCIDNYVPGLLKWFEAADLAGLVAPRGLACESGLQDSIFPEAGVRTAVDGARAIYGAVGAPEKFAHEFFEGGHLFHGSLAFDRLAAWLGPA